MWSGFAVAACSTTVPASLPVYILFGIAGLCAAEIPREHACLYSNAESAPSATSQSPCYPTCRLSLAFPATGGRPTLIASPPELVVCPKGREFRAGVHLVLAACVGLLDVHMPSAGSRHCLLHLWGYLTSTCRAPHNVVAH